MGALQAAWVGVNGVLFAVLLVYSVRLLRSAQSQAISRLSAVIALVSAAFVLGGIQLIGLELVRVGVLPGWVGDFLITWWQTLLSAAVTAAAVYALTRLRSSLRQVERGERMVAVLTERIPLDLSVSEWGLTARELQVLETIVSGHTSDDDIAERLFISPSTAATHVRNILRKSGLSRRMDLMLVGGEQLGRVPNPGDPGS